jgi:hypothetical protein
LRVTFKNRAIKGNHHFWLWAFRQTHFRNGLLSWTVQLRKHAFQVSESNRRRRQCPDLAAAVLLHRGSGATTGLKLGRCEAPLQMPVFDIKDFHAR